MESSQNLQPSRIRAIDLPFCPFNDTAIKSIFSEVAWGIRYTWHSSLQASPGQVAFGRDMVVTSTYIENWRFIKQRKEKVIIYDNARTINTMCNMIIGKVNLSMF